MTNAQQNFNPGTQRLLEIKASEQANQITAMALRIQSLEMEIQGLQALNHRMLKIEGYLPVIEKAYAGQIAPVERTIDELENGSRHALSLAGNDEVLQHA